MHKLQELSQSGRCVVCDASPDQSRDGYYLGKPGASFFLAVLDGQHCLAGCGKLILPKSKMKIVDKAVSLFCLPSTLIR